MISNEYKNRSYPFISDAPTSDLDDGTTKLYYKFLDEEFEQSIATDAQIIEEDKPLPKKAPDCFINKNVEYTEKEPVLALIRKDENLAYLRVVSMQGDKKLSNITMRKDFFFKNYKMITCPSSD